MAIDLKGSAIRIDSHQHFWRYTPEEYGWIDDEMRSIRRDYLPEHLEPAIHSCGIGGVVSVQARQTLEETRWLLHLAALHDFITGVVGWIPLVADDVPDILAPLTEQRQLKAVRHVLQGEPDDRYMLRADFNRGIDALSEFGLLYDVLIFERHLPQTIEFVDRHPGQVFVVDHAAKPRIRDHVLSPWRENMFRLAERSNVYCKISGLVTEADYNGWTKQDLMPYLDTLLAAFGPQRLMFGSDWPVCLVATKYGDWFNLVAEQIQTLSDVERDAILGGTARRVYALDLPSPKASRLPADDPYH
ncbi:MAG: amidohydrolase family protein [Acidobacteriaceae bacterium]|nr:amidohydrolase family protein [Acidobacteriaceae bacterium]